MRSIRPGTALLLLLLWPAAGAQAGPVLDRIRADKAIRCAAAERPGLLERQEEGGARGLFVDLCRAIGTAVAGPAVQVVLDVDESAKSADAMRAGRDDIAFLTGAEIVADRLADAVVPGPPVFYETTALMVTAASPMQKPADLAGAPICFLEGGSAERHLQAWFAEHKLDFVRMGYQEDVEMQDAFDSRRCTGLAGEATTLAAIRLDGGASRRGGRILDEALATTPILAVTGTGDGAWSGLVAWSVATLQNADRPAHDWAAGGRDSLPLAGIAGLPADWQTGLVGADGSYATLLRRSVGVDSPLRLPPGPNALAGQGGLLRPVEAQ